MHIKKSKLINIPSSEITSEHIYISRRRFLKTAIAVAGGAFVAACSPIPTTFPATATPSPSQTTTTPTDEYGNPVSSYDHITSFNNFYEFTYDKKQVKSVAKDFPTSPWKVEIKGLVNNPLTLDVDDLVKRYSQEERIYRMMCVEGWWMVIPWMGFSLASLLEDPQHTRTFLEILQAEPAL